MAAVVDRVTDLCRLMSARLPLRVSRSWKATLGSIAARFLSPFLLEDEVRVDDQHAYPEATWGPSGKRTFSSEATKQLPPGRSFLCRAVVKEAGISTRGHVDNLCEESYEDRQQKPRCSTALL